MAKTSSARFGSRGRRRLLVLVPLLVVAGVAAYLLLGSTGPEPTFEGPGEEETLNAAAVEELAFVATSEDAGALAQAVVRHDGRDVSDRAEHSDGELRYAPRDLEDGEHEVQITVPDRFGEHSERWVVTVDATPPALEITRPEDPVVFRNRETVVAGTTDPDAELTVAGESVEVDDEGAFEARWDEPPAETIVVEATDPVGNVSREQLELTVLRSRVEVDEIRGVHVTGHAWQHPELRGQVMQMIEDGRINTVQLDLKGEGGRVYHSTDVGLADEMGASFDLYELEDVVDELHDRGVHIVGRIVAFKDPTLGEYAQGNGDMDWLVQTPGGEPYTGQYPCCFASFANDEVVEYNIALAEEAAKAGVDGILWDYVRRPDGDPDSLVVPGLSDDAGGRTLEEAVVDFVAAADERLAPYHVEHGASVYGIAATRPTQIAQDIEGISQHVDYVSPMLYPSHWGPGEYDVADPIRQPYDIVYRSLEEFIEITEASGRARVVPWLEDSNYRAWDRREQVREQIRAAADRDIDEWLMWDPHVDYTVDAYEPAEE